MNLSRLDTETFDEYKIRICSYKDKLGYTWADIAQLINEECDINFSPDAYRKAYSTYLKMNSGIKQSSSSYSMEDIQKERLKIRDERVQLNSVLRSISREETLKEIAVECVKELPNTVDILPPKPDYLYDLYQSRKSCKKTAILVISDWHYGLEADLYYNKYNPEICKERLNKLVEKVSMIIGSQNDAVERLVVLNLGDMISGNIHLPLRINTRVDVISQTIQVSELLAEFLNSLSYFTPVLDYYSVTDNHSRIDSNKKESLQIESFTRIIDWWLKERLKDNNVITFNDNKFGDDIASFSVYNHEVIGVHGDKDRQSNIITQLNSYGQCHWDMILSAHMHHVSSDELNQTEFYCNGSLCGTDDFSNSLRLHSSPSQLLILSTEDNVSECIYKIKLD